MEFLLSLMRMLHLMLGITPAEPEHERTYLLLWTVSFAVIFVVVVASIMFLVPRIMH